MDAYDYGLPDDAIAQSPVEPRSAARMLVDPSLAGSARADPGRTGSGRTGSGSTDLDGTGLGSTDPNGVGHATVADLPAYLRPGDLLVVNETRVLAARLSLVKRTGGAAEVLLLEPSLPGTTTSTVMPAPLTTPPEVATSSHAPTPPDAAVPSGATVPSEAGLWEALVRPGRRLPPGTLLWEGIGGEPVVEVGEPIAGHDDGRRQVRLLDPEVVARAGAVPLPPYIHTPLSDPDRYQTVYATPPAPSAQSIAAPTAGLHLTPEVLAACGEAGASIATVDLAIGLGTFRPVTAPTPEQHFIHTERYVVPEGTMAACREATRVIAIGTTAVRALETAAATGQLSGRTDLYIHGRYPFRVVDVLLTNFHLPRSTLLLLVEAFYGPQWRELYATALSAGYRFLSFGDAMLLNRGRGGDLVPG